MHPTGNKMNYLVKDILVAALLLLPLGFSSGSGAAQNSRIQTAFRVAIPKDATVVKQDSVLMLWGSHPHSRLQPAPSGHHHSYHGSHHKKHGKDEEKFDKHYDKGFVKGHKHKANKGFHHDEHYGKKGHDSYGKKGSSRHGDDGGKSYKGSHHEDSHKGFFKKGSEGSKGKNFGHKGKFHKGHKDKGFAHKEDKDSWLSKHDDHYKKGTGIYGKSHKGINKYGKNNKGSDGHYKAAKGKKHNGGSYSGGYTWDHKGGDSFSAKGKYHDDYADHKGKYGYHGYDHKHHKDGGEGGHHKANKYVKGDPLGHHSHHAPSYNEGPVHHHSSHSHHHRHHTPLPSHRHGASENQGSHSTKDEVVAAVEIKKQDPAQDRQMNLERNPRRQRNRRPRRLKNQNRIPNRQRIHGPRNLDHGVVYQLEGSTVLQPHLHHNQYKQQLDPQNSSHGRLSGQHKTPQNSQTVPSGAYAVENHTPQRPNNLNNQGATSFVHHSMQNSPGRREQKEIYNHPPAHGTHKTPSDDNRPIQYQRNKARPQRPRYDENKREEHSDRKTQNYQQHIHPQPQQFKKNYENNNNHQYSVNPHAYHHSQGLEGGQPLPILNHDKYQNVKPFDASPKINMIEESHEKKRLPHRRRPHRNRHHRERAHTNLHPKQSSSPHRSHPNRIKEGKKKQSPKSEVNYNQPLIQPGEYNQYKPVRTENTRNTPQQHLKYSYDSREVDYDNHSSQKDSRPQLHEEPNNSQQHENKYYSDQNSGNDEEDYPNRDDDIYILYPNPETEQSNRNESPAPEPDYYYDDGSAPQQEPRQYHEKQSQKTEYPDRQREPYTYSQEQPPKTQHSENYHSTDNEDRHLPSNIPPNPKIKVYHQEEMPKDIIKTKKPPKKSLAKASNDPRPREEVKPASVVHPKPNYAPLYPQQNFFSPIRSAAQPKKSATNKSPSAVLSKSNFATGFPNFSFDSFGDFGKVRAL